MDQKRTRDQVNEDLRRWFKEKWVDISRKDKSGKHPECGASSSSKSRKKNINKAYPKCRPSVRVSEKTPETSGEMSEKEKKAASKKKRKVEREKPDKKSKAPHYTTHKKKKKLRENMERIHIKSVEPEMVLQINEQACFVSSINRIGDTTYCVNYISENKQYGREFFLKNDYIDLLNEVEYDHDLTEEKETKKKLNKPFRTPGGPKKFSVYVKNEKGNVVKVNFGDPNMEIKRDDPKRRKSFRARHNCANPGPKTKARYWSCYQWRKASPVADSYLPTGNMISESREEDHEYSMARSQIETIERGVQELKKKLGRKPNEGELEAWVQSKITRAADYVDTVADYMQSNEPLGEESDCGCDEKKKKIKESHSPAEAKAIKRIAKRLRDDAKKLESIDEGILKTLAKKHKVSEDDIKEQLKMGIEVEKEHTDDSTEATVIALDHLEELPDYYTKLKTYVEPDEINEENKPTNPKLWSKAKSLAKKKFKVYPSAYANGWAAKWYKKHGGKWKTVNEERLVGEKKKERDNISRQLDSMDLTSINNKNKRFKNRVARIIAISNKKKEG